MPPARESSQYADDFDDFKPASFKPSMVTNLPSGPVGIGRRDPAVSPNGVLHNTTFSDIPVSTSPRKSVDHPFNHKPLGNDGFVHEMATKPGFEKIPHGVKTKPERPSFIHQSSASSLSKKNKPARRKKTAQPLSANLDEIAKLLSELDSARMEISKLKDENRNLKIDNRRQGKAIKQSDAEQNDIPRVIQTLTDEVRRAKLQAKQYHDKLAEIEKTSHHHVEEAIKMQERVHKLTRLLNERGFEDAEHVSRTMKQLKARVEVLEKENEELERYVNHFKTNKSLDQRTVAGHKSKLVAELEDLKLEHAKLITKMAEKDRILASASMYTRHSNGKGLAHPPITNKSVMSDVESTGDAGELSFFGGVSPNKSKAVPTAADQEKSDATETVHMSHSTSKSIAPEPIIKTPEPIKKDLSKPANALAKPNFSLSSNETGITPSKSAGFESKQSASSKPSPYVEPVSLPPTSTQHAQPSSFLKPSLFASLDTSNTPTVAPSPIPEISSSPRNKIEPVFFKEESYEPTSTAPSSFFKPTPIGIAPSKTLNPAPIALSIKPAAIQPVQAVASYRADYEEDVEELQEDFV
ncbi:hypothetical protein SmJEL517_g02069 [Synchytrium microbalum]|uniref:Lebercilin domain-containing protein n=1 Tax=Synchytrium microbalum TaxID=1806994 RepID=A0A507CC03_9FUNG|nr:uncharacterized protein SmJEL517_g02069 [Synchytrium microbalum]TPX35546.1 hypothetical protein SmJEL517_g02069 [Synchytrium microbalum]